MPRTKVEIAAEIFSVKADIASTERDIRNTSWEILEVQGKMAAAQGIISGNFGFDQKSMAQQQYQEFYREEVDLKIKRDWLEMDVLRFKGKVADLERELQLAN